MQTSPAKVEHLYIHVPFCATKCRYCAFYSEPGQTDKMSAFVATVTAELQPWVDRLAPKTIFVGGGTPSILPAPLLQQLFAGLRRSLEISEWTVECNPATVTAEKTAVFVAAGVTRISLGMQSLDNQLLQTLGRIHTAETAVATYRELRAAGFDNLNLDLMFGLPGQTLEQWRTTLYRAIELQPDHFSTYCLSLEEDTEFWKLYSGTGVPPVHVGSQERSKQAGRPFHSLLPDDETQLAMYELAIDTLAAAGYRQYEVSNFAKPGRECRHNIAGWEGQDYLGLGPSACSTVGDRRWQNVADLDRYLAGWRASLPASRPGAAWPEPRPPVLAFEEHVSEPLKAAERAAFGMRMTAGIPAALVRGRFDRQAAKLLSADLAYWQAGRLCPTRRGILFADEVATEFV